MLATMVLYDVQKFKRKFFLSSLNKYTICNLCAKRVDDKTHSKAMKTLAILY